VSLCTCTCTACHSQWDLPPVMCKMLAADNACMPSMLISFMFISRPAPCLEDVRGRIRDYNLATEPLSTSAWLITARSTTVTQGRTCQSQLVRLTLLSTWQICYLLIVNDVASLRSRSAAVRCIVCCAGVRLLLMLLIAADHLFATTFSISATWHWQ
jgi:hypothetical protein